LILISQENLSIYHFYSNGMEGLGLTGVQEVFLASFEEIKNESRIIRDESEEDLPVNTVIMDSIPVTRSSSRLGNRKDPQINPSVSESQVIRNEASATHADWVSIQTPAAEAIVSGDRPSEEHGISSVAPVHENGTIKWSNVPRQPIPELNYERRPTEYQHMAPEGELIASLEGHPEGLLAILGDNGLPRIIVPRNLIKALVLQCHEDIHHQSHVKVLCILKPLYYWPGMTKDIEKLCTAYYVEPASRPQCDAGS
jgi:hypothetical protein